MSASVCAGSSTRLETVGAAALSPWGALVPPPACPPCQAEVTVTAAPAWQWGWHSWEPARHKHQAARKGLGN